MSSATVTALAIGIALVVTIDAHAQAPPTPSAPSAPSKTKPGVLELTGCVSGQPSQSGEFTFTDSETGGKYRLTGKGLRKYAGQMVQVVSGPLSKGLAVRGGLWPSPNLAGQAGGVDPAQESIARQPGGAASRTGGAELPEFHVAKVRAVDGACQ